MFNPMSSINDPQSQMVVRQALERNVKTRDTKCRPINIQMQDRLNSNKFLSMKTIEGLGSF